VHDLAHRIEQNVSRVLLGKSQAVELAITTSSPAATC
jgi:hypothetical protein